MSPPVNRMRKQESIDDGTLKTLTFGGSRGRWDMKEMVIRDDFGVSE